MTSTTIKKRVLIALIISICLIAMAFWLYGKFYVSTDDAYVNANIVAIGSRVNGQVQLLYVKNNQFVKKDQPLFDLDPATYREAVTENKANVDYAEAKLKIAQITATRISNLVTTHANSAQEGDTAIANLQSAIAQKAAAESLLRSAQLNLQYTHITAPANGWISNLNLRAGNSVTANQAVFALVTSEEFWIDANFKETDLKHIHIGQSADIQVDMYPGYHFKGIVESISRGSGNVFSLLPPENATGNWVKVTQRVPVRIQVINPDPTFPLRIGTSANVTIHIR